MAHQKLGNGQNTERETDIAVVAPSNMGKGHKWNAETNQYDIDITPPNSRTGSGLNIDGKGQLAVALSKDPTNLLQMKPDGVYYGDKAPANLSNLYVDALNGVDQHPDDVEGAGTQTKPLRTLKYALDLGVEGTTRTVYLKERQDHIVYSEKRITLKSGQINVRSYGDEVSSWIRNGIVVDGFHRDAKAYNENVSANIVFKGIETLRFPFSNTSDKWNIFNGVIISILNNTKINFSGVNLINDLGFTLNADVDKGNYNYISNAFRIACHSGSIVELSNVRMHTRGSPYFVGEPPLGRSEKVNNLIERNSDGLWSFGFFCQLGGDISLRNIERSTEQLDSIIFGRFLWGQEYAINSSISFYNDLIVKNMEFKKYISGMRKFTQTSGDVVVLNPLVNVSWELFK